MSDLLLEVETDAQVTSSYSLGVLRLASSIDRHPCVMKVLGREVSVVDLAVGVGVMAVLQSLALLNIDVPTMG